MTDVAVIGGGVVGCATAAFLAEGGAEVTLYEREAIGAGASGRNSGIVQHPMDPALAELYEASLELYRGLGHGFALPAEPSGVLLVSHDGEALGRDFDAARRRFPDLNPIWLADPRADEPALAPGVFAYRLDTGRPIGPTAATRAWATRAEAAGARLEIGRAVRAADLTADAVVIAAGPWSADALGADLPVAPNWGVVAQVRLPEPPRHALEEAGIEALTAPGGAGGSLFSLVTTNGASAVGSTFSPDAPDAAAVAPAMVAHAARYVPAVGDAAIEHLRACARPLSADGRPLLGQVSERVHLVTGHGAWGVTLGPGSAKLVADALLGRGDAIPEELRADR